MNPADPTHAAGQLDINGYATFGIYVDSDDPHSSAGINLDAAFVTISNAANPYDNTGALPMQFKPYARAAQNTIILGYGCVSGTPADGKTHASVYVGVDMKKFPLDQSQRYVLVEIENSTDAWIDGFGGHKQTHKITLADDGTATAYILSAQPQQNLKIQISALAQDFATVYMDFVAVPTFN
ncbi:hypothetical protein C9I57_27690 [Trinickia symbiotica]|uniref:Uncharacterized protein n=2 Tax=Trinickia symbiotica TaxID=863227 RepID=A0A2T3XLS4_9BURK|nr:hypothetical protein C9I57_27690 [Trinickia symbiotica]